MDAIHACMFDKPAM